MNIPQGVYEWSKEFGGLPETNNTGIVKTEINSLSITTFARSFDPQKLEGIAKVIEATAAKSHAEHANKNY